MSSLRCFVALPLREGLRLALEKVGAQVREAEPGWRDQRWVSPDLMHVTLKFLGDVDEGEIEAVCASLRQVAASHTPFEMELAGVRATPGTGRCRMLWATFHDGSGACASLAEAVDAALERHGVERERRPFSAHVTLCRARQARQISAGALQVPAAGAIVGECVSVASVSLVSSRLGRGRPEYTTLCSWPLGK